MSTTALTILSLLVLVLLPLFGVWVGRRDAKARKQLDGPGLDDVWLAPTSTAAGLVCPACGHTFTRAIALCDPNSGGLVVMLCIPCRAPLVYTGTALRHPERDELDRIMADPTARLAITAVGELHRRGTAQP